jgi:hypothetical protein
MWIKTLKLGYWNTDHIQKIRIASMGNTPIRKSDEPIPMKLYRVELVSDNQDVAGLTEGVPEERAEELLEIIVKALSDVPEPGTFQVPYEPPIE